MHNAIESEKAILGSILQENQAIDEVLDMFEDPQVFYDSRNRNIFKAMVSLYNRHDPMDLVNVSQFMFDEGYEEADSNIGYYLSQLLEVVPSSAHIGSHRDIVYEKYRQRESVKIYHQAKKDLEAGEISAEVNDRTIQAVDALQLQKKSEIIDFADVLSAGMDRIESILGGNSPGYETGFTDLDRKIQGFEPGEYIVLAGRPSHGKTAFALKLTTNLAAQGVPVLFISTETKVAKIGSRFILEQAGVPLEKQHAHKIALAPSHMMDRKIFVRDIGSLSSSQLRAVIKSQIHKNGIQMVVVDFVQRLYSASAENRTNELRHVSSTIKDLSQEYNLISLVLSQLRKDAEGKIPEMGHIRESGDIEQDADKIMGIAAASRINQKELPARFKDATWDELSRLTLLNCCKVKDGEIGIVPLYTDPRCYRYENYETRMSRTTA